MTYEEAMKCIKHAKEESLKVLQELEKVKNKAEIVEMVGEYYSNFENCKKEIQACDLAINAIEKQVAKKPDLEGDGFDSEREIIYDTWICTRCNKSYEVDYDEYDYCPNCGQKLDWRDGDETN